MNEEKTPAATPAATEWGEAVRRNTRLARYWVERSQLLRGHNATLSLSCQLAGFLRENSILHGSNVHWIAGLPRIGSTGNEIRSKKLWLNNRQINLT